MLPPICLEYDTTAGSFLHIAPSECNSLAYLEYDLHCHVTLHYALITAITKILSKIGNVLLHSKAVRICLHTVLVFAAA